MAKKKLQKENLNENEVVDVNNGKKGSAPKTEEEIYVESLSKKERKLYERKKRELRRSQWMSEYWIIIVLSVALLVVATVLIIINQVRDYYDTGNVKRIIDFISPIVDNIKLKG